MSLMPEWMKQKSFNDKTASIFSTTWTERDEWIEMDLCCLCWSSVLTETHGRLSWVTGTFGAVKITPTGMTPSRYNTNVLSNKRRRDRTWKLTTTQWNEMPHILLERTVMLYFKVSLFQCNCIFKYWVIFINHTYYMVRIRLSATCM